MVYPVFLIVMFQQVVLYLLVLLFAVPTVQQMIQGMTITIFAAQ